MKKVQNFFHGIATAGTITKNVLKAFFVIGIVGGLLACPPLLIAVVVGEFVWRIYGLPHFIRTLPGGIKQMPMLIPWLCIPIPFTSVKWAEQWVCPNSPIHGNNPESAAIKKNFDTDWSYLSKLRGTAPILLTNDLQDAWVPFREHCKMCKKKGDPHKGTVMVVPAIVAEDLAKTWVKVKVK